MAYTVKDQTKLRHEVTKTTILLPPVTHVCIQDRKPYIRRENPSKMVYRKIAQTMEELN